MIEPMCKYYLYEKALIRSRHLLCFQYSLPLVAESAVMAELHVVTAAPHQIGIKSSKRGTKASTPAVQVRPGCKRGKKSSNREAV